MHINDGEVFRVRLELGRNFIRLITHTGHPILVERVLEVETGQLCYIVGTVYMDMPMKPNIIEDIARDVGDPFLNCNLLYTNCP
jgi:DNA polymerase delta subunit 2